MRNDLRDLTLLFVKIVGPEVFWGNFDCAGEQNYRSCLGVGILRSYQSVPPNLATGLDAKRRSNVIFSRKEKKGGSHTFISPRVRSDPLRLLGSDVTGDRSEGGELMFVFTRTPYLRTLMIAV